MELREILKKAVWDGMDARCVEPCWAATNTDTIRGCGCMDKAADAILSALDAAGLVVVPREPTEEMISAGEDRDRPAGEYSGYSTEFARCEQHYAAMIAASPFAKKDVG